MVVNFNPRFFDEMARMAGVEELTEKAAKKVLSEAQASAPVDTGAYRDGLVIRSHRSAHRKVYRVVGTNWKTMLVESKTGNLVKALRRSRG